MAYISIFFKLANHNELTQLFYFNLFMINFFHSVQHHATDDRETRPASISYDLITDRHICPHRTKSVKHHIIIRS